LTYGWCFTLDVLRDFIKCPRIERMLTEVLSQMLCECTPAKDSNPVQVRQAEIGDEWLLSQRHAGLLVLYGCVLYG